MNKWITFGVFFGVAILGGVLAFAIDDGHLRAKPLGLVLLTAGAVLVVGWCGDRWFSRTARAGNTEGSKPNPPAGPSPAPTGIDALRAVAGLIAVLAAVGSIVALFVLTISLKSGFTADNAIAFATSAFGVISAITGAYLGIKITSDQAAGTQQAAGIAQAQAAASQVADPKQKDELQVQVAQAAAAQVQRPAGA